MSLDQLKGLQRPSVPSALVPSKHGGLGLNCPHLGAQPASVPTLPLLGSPEFENGSPKSSPAWGLYGGSGKAAGEWGAMATWSSDLTRHTGSAVLWIQGTRAPGCPSSRMSRSQCGSQDRRGVLRACCPSLIVSGGEGAGSQCQAEEEVGPSHQSPRRARHRQGRLGG